VHKCFSALLCVYQQSQLSEVVVAISSAFEEQSKPPAELVVVLDGPVCDDLRAWLMKRAEEWACIILELPVNMGHGVARAEGLKHCRYEWVAIIDADDISLPNRFEVLLGEIEKFPKAVVVGGSLQEFHELEGKRYLGRVRKFPGGDEEVRRYARMRSPVAQPTAIIRKSVIIGIGNYQSWFHNEDYHLWLRLISLGFSIRNVEDIVLLFRVKPELYSRRGGIKYWISESRLQIFSWRMGTTSLSWVLVGVATRFVVQVAVPRQLRAWIYNRILR
jgi:glycosyltransferase involved in cell wall biosynthesis